mmetsp:Transcript_35720/g.91188  ORF Transcript_35720/g.91188 Transcript_35720/m.91188 type:complete len:301 (-) Transcript_35720:935-1837(-)|eukprot:jgi/Tetstr1/426383/TSEL_016695.t1
MAKEATVQQVCAVLRADAGEVFDFLREVRARSEGSDGATSGCEPPYEGTPHVLAEPVTFRARQYRCIRVDGQLPVTPTVALALTEHEMFRPDAAASWRKLVLEGRVPEQALRGRLLYEKYALPDGTCRQSLTLHASRLLEPHSYAVASWSPDVRHPEYPDTLNNASTGQYVGEYFSPSGPVGVSKTTRYTCVVAVAGMPEEAVPYLVTHLSSRVQHMQGNFKDEGVTRLFEGLVTAALAERAEEMAALNISPVSTAEHTFTAIQRETGLTLTAAPGGPMAALAQCALLRNCVPSPLAFFR